MKNAIVIALGMLAATAANAKTMCTLNTGDGKVYDRSLFYGDLSVSRSLVISKDGKEAKQVEFTEMKTLEQWKAIDGLTIVTFAAQDNGGVGIVAGHVDLSQTSNILPLEAIATGSVADKRPVGLIVPAKRLSATCFQLN